MIKILYTATVVKTHLAAFHLPYLAWCKVQGWEVHAAAKNDYAPDACVIPNCDHYYDIPFARNPFSLRNLKAYRMLKRIIDENEYDIIHCNTPVGAAITRLAACAARKRGAKVIYTAHGFHFYKGAPLLNSMLYQSAERLLAPYTDALLTINHEDYAAAKTFRVDRVLYVPGVGIDTARFSSRLDREAVRRSLGLMQEDIMLFSVGELIARKNHRVLLQALAGSDPRYKLYICGDGPLRASLEGLAAEIDVSKRVHLLGFRRDIPALCAAADMFLFPSLQEGLPVALMEAMAAGLPCVASAIRGNTDLIRNGENGILCPPPDVRAFQDAVTRLGDDPTLREKLGWQAQADAKAYDLSAVLPQVTALYEELLKA